MIHLVSWTVTSAFLANVVVLGTCIVLARPLRHVPIPAVRTYWYDLALRALLVAMLVGFVVSVSFQIGPAGSGILAVFPIILISLVLILHRRIGGKPTAAILANGVLGLVGFGFACVVLHFAAVPLGAAIGLTLALCTSVAGHGVLLRLTFARRHTAVRRPE